MKQNKYNISIVGQSNTGKSTLTNYLCDKYVTAESKKLQGKGIADMRKEMAEGMKEAMKTMEESGLSSHEALKFILEATRLDTIEGAAKYGSLILMDSDKESNLGSIITAVKAANESDTKSK